MRPTRCSLLLVVVINFVCDSCRVKKRSREFDVGQSVCPSESQWRALDSALDINNSAVRVYQPSNDHSNDQSNESTADGEVATGDQRPPLRQWFYTVTCRNDVMASLRHCPGCCLAVDHSRSVDALRLSLSVGAWALLSLAVHYS